MVYRQPPRVFYSAAFFVLVMTLVIFVKPPGLFLPDGRVRPFGTGEDCTVISIGIVATVAALLSLFMFAWIDLVTTKIGT
jgi:hypothetical protein